MLALADEFEHRAIGEREGRGPRPWPAQLLSPGVLAPWPGCGGIGLTCLFGPMCKASVQGAVRRASFPVPQPRWLSPAVLTRIFLFCPGVFTECYRKDEERAQKLLIRVSEAWGKTTCLQLALEAKDMKFVSHGGIQVTSRGRLQNQVPGCSWMATASGSCRWHRCSHLVTRDTPVMATRPHPRTLPPSL